MTVSLGEEYDEEYNIYIAIYIDKKYMNNTLITINDFNKSRLSDTKSDRKQPK